MADEIKTPTDFGGDYGAYKKSNKPLSEVLGGDFADDPASSYEPIGTPSNQVELPDTTIERE